MPLHFSDSKEIDVDQVLALYRHTDWAKDRTREETGEILTRSSLVFGLWEGPRLVAFARVLTDFVARAGIYDVIVHPEAQKKGVGRMLIEQMLGHSSLQKVPVFHLLTKDKRLFYEKLGFVTAGERGYSAMIFNREKEKKK